MKLSHAIATALGVSVLGLATIAPADGRYRAEVVEDDPDGKDKVCATSSVGKTFRRQEAVIDEQCSNGNEVCSKIRVYRDWTVAKKSRDGRACMWKLGKRQFSVLDCEQKSAAFDGRTCLSVGQEYLIKNR